MEEEDQQQVILPPRYIRQLYDVDVILWITEESETLAHHSLPCTELIFFRRMDISISSKRRSNTVILDG